MVNIHDLTITYDKTILKDIDIDFKPGEIAVIKGQSGSGKSSLLNILGLMRKPNKECQYKINGININFEDEEEKANVRLNKIGFVFQQNNLLNDFSIYDNIAMPLRMISSDELYIKNKVETLIEYVSLSSLKDKYPSDLSGGEEQRTAIARALVNDADIILADEPTAALDQGNVENILSLFKKLAYELNKIVIIVSHDDNISKIGDVIYTIENQKLVKTYSKI